MGPSGSGKTSLLNLLAKRIVGGKNGKEITGTVLANNEPITASYRKDIAYVSQQDLLYATATCEEAFEFSARLRLPQSYSKNEQSELIEDMIKSLGLQKCRKTIIGNAYLRGVSGGERKRIAIGVELLSNPRILFLGRLFKKLLRKSN